MTRFKSSGRSIVCPIDLFDRIEREIEDLTAAVNRAPTAVEKATPAGELRRTVSVLLECKAYDDDNINCRLCRELSELRDKTARMVVEAAKLAP